MKIYMSARILKKKKPFKKRKSLSKLFKETLFKPQGRITLLFFLFSFVFLAFFIRLYDLQIKNGKYFRSVANAQNLKIRYDFFDRGTIFFKDKDKDKFISVAGIIDEYYLAIDPKLVKNPEKLYRELSYIVNIDKNKFYKSISNKNSRYELLINPLDKKDAEKIKKIKSRALIVGSRNKRYYPASSLAARVIGFVSNGKDGEIRGRYGIEKYWDDYLGYDNSYAKKNFFASLFLSFSDIKKTQKSNVYSTIYIPVQRYVEKVLQDVLNEYDAEFASAIVMDPNTGEIIAMATIPSFDLNNFSKYSAKYYSNNLVERVYEMGSIMKPITVAAGLDAGVITEYTTYNDTGHVYIDGHTIYNYDKKGRGPNTTIQQILSDSLNTGVVFITRKLGKDMFRKYVKEFGLMEETGIDLPYETSNLVSNLDSPRFIEYATASFGQGIAFTPISFIRAFAALSTGYLVQPHVISATETNMIKKQRDYSDLKKRVIKDETVKMISKLLTYNVDHSLVKGKYSLEKYSVAAKTGTAQVAGADGKYKKDVVMHTFAGYFPSYNPRFVILIMLMNPKGVNYSSESLPEPFFKIVKFLINYFNIPPDR